MAISTERLAELKARATLFTGIDFVHVAEPTVQTQLLVYFLTDLDQLDPGLTTDPNQPDHLLPEHVTIRRVGDNEQANVPVTHVDGPIRDDALNLWFLEVEVAEPGDFADYRLFIADPRVVNGVAEHSRIDVFFNDVKFSFKAGCETEQDCLEPEPVCPPEEAVDFPVDYLARDFVSLRNALLDFSAQRYPEHTLPIEADVGVMLAEVMAALGDELSYIQDRYAREAHLETATERRSLRKKARLLDYEIHDGRSPATFLELVVSGDGSVNNEDDLETKGPARVWAGTEGDQPVAFTLGTGLRDEGSFAVRREWNASDTGDPLLEGDLTPYCFDASQTCLQVGATELFIEGDLKDREILDAEMPGRVMLLRTEPEDPAVPRRRHFVRIEALTPAFDPLLDKVLTRIAWQREDALPFQIDQQILQLSLNVLPATAGEEIAREFICGGEPELGSATPHAVERAGPLFTGRLDRPTVYLFGLPETDVRGLGFLGQSLRNTLPEIRIHEGPPDDPGDEWIFRRSLLGSNDTESVFTLEDGIWRRIVAYQFEGRDIVHKDYATGLGFSVRFGDGVFGRIPADGTRFTVRYRLGPGARANVPADSINRLEFPELGIEKNLPDVVRTVTNPVEVRNGQDPESADDIKQLTPEAFRAELLFATRPNDYREQAEKLDFLQRAYGTPRWTGSWTSIFVSGDPFGASTMTPEQFDQLESWLDCVRQTGRDVIVKNPKTLAIDLQIEVCLEPFALPGQVQAQLEAVLIGHGGGRDQRAFFSPDNFTFGTPLRRSALEAAIQSVPGVRFVSSIIIRERGFGQHRPFTELIREVDPDQIIVLDNDPLRPANGSLQISFSGGA